MSKWHYKDGTVLDERGYLVAMQADTAGDNSAADGRLLAAAPDLLEACKAIVADRQESYEVERESYEMVTAAIRKAEEG